MLCCHRVTCEPWQGADGLGVPSFLLAMPYSLNAHKLVHAHTDTTTISTGISPGAASYTTGHYQTACHYWLFSELLSTRSSKNDNSQIMVNRFLCLVWRSGVNNSVHPISKHDFWHESKYPTGNLICFSRHRVRSADAWKSIWLRVIDSAFPMVCNGSLSRASINTADQQLWMSDCMCMWLIKMHPEGECLCGKTWVRSFSTFLKMF